MKENYNEKEWRLSTVEQALDAFRQGGRSEEHTV